jgi:hypothetical protein
MDAQAAIQEVSVQLCRRIATVTAAGDRVRVDVCARTVAGSGGREWIATP